MDEAQRSLAAAIDHLLSEAELQRVNEEAFGPYASPLSKNALREALIRSARRFMAQTDTPDQRSQG